MCGFTMFVVRAAAMFPARTHMPLAVLVLAPTWAVPVGVKRVDPETVSRSLTRNVLTADVPRQFTKSVLFERAFAPCMKRQAYTLR